MGPGWFPYIYKYFFLISFGSNCGGSVIGAVEMHSDCPIGNIMYKTQRKNFNFGDSTHIAVEITVLFILKSWPFKLIAITGLDINCILEHPLVAVFMS